MQKTTLARGFWNAFLFLPLSLTISIDHIQVNEHFNTVNSCTGSKLHCHRTSKTEFYGLFFPAARRRRHHHRRRLGLRK